MDRNLGPFHYKDEEDDKPKAPSKPWASEVLARMKIKSEKVSPLLEWWLNKEKK